MIGTVPKSPRMLRLTPQDNVLVAIDTVGKGAMAPEGITALEPLDIKFAGELGYVVKLLAIAERTTEGKIALRVHPTLVHHTDVLAEVSGGFNAISVYGNALGHAPGRGQGCPARRLDIRKSL